MLPLPEYRKSPQLAAPQLPSTNNPQPVKASRFPEPSYRYPPARLLPTSIPAAVASDRLRSTPVPLTIEERGRAESGFRAVNTQSWFDDSIRYALKVGASDLHLTLNVIDVRLTARLRIDGIMREFAVIHGNDARTIMGRFKAAAELSSGGSFVPEESLYSILVDGEVRKARVALFRDHNAGDALVLRLPPTGELLSLDQLGFGESNLTLFHTLLRAANRMVLIAGPMGSGKTTTAHAALKQVTTSERIVWSVEDPVERMLPGVVQLEVDEANGAGFSTLLPVLVRSDYDTLFLGEIRDKGTAAAGVRQSKAGRQVITTIHANDNVTALLRLIELAEDSPLSCMDAVRGVVSQRLMRRLNPQWDGETADQKYRGRVPVHEVLVMNDELTEAVMRDQPIREIKKIAAAASENTFERDAMRLMESGITDQAEVNRVLGE
ncbi:MAG: Flp pilus assembly complex ATPase component TadA [Microbacteriaceae bacterium]|nr:Flp pilus assembly complex ATPase component TadA [Microbacteriaceae bacterium]